MLINNYYTIINLYPIILKDRIEIKLLIKDVRNGLVTDVEGANFNLALEKFLELSHYHPEFFNWVKETH